MHRIRLDCRFGQPHDFEQIKDTPTWRVEKCKRCGKIERWNKGYKGRISNKKYLKSHIRNFAQPGGATKRIYQKMYHPETCEIIIQ